MATDKSQEILGGIQNALERGASLEEAQKSFMNAGYTQEEITQATTLFQKQFPGGVTVVPQGTATKTPKENITTPQPQKGILKMPVGKSTASIGTNLEANKQKPKNKKWLYIVLVIASLVVIVGAAFLGIFWNEFIDMINTIW